MPILNHKLYFPQRRPDVLLHKATYHIPFTNEKFDSKLEYEKQLGFYNQSIWCCQSTGNSGLTYEEAAESEKCTKELLGKEFPEVFEKPVLELVHHSCKSIDSLVDEAYVLLHTELIVGEDVSLMHGSKNAGKVCKVTRISSKGDASSKSQTTPRAGNKENSTSPDKTPKPAVSLELKPFLYSVRLEESAKGAIGQVVNNIPATELNRIHEVPSKRLLRLFIRTYAVRVHYGMPRSPWIADDDMCRKHGLQNKLAKLFVTPTPLPAASKAAKTASTGKQMAAENIVEEKSTAKRKLSLTPGSTQKKKSKTPAVQAPPPQLISEVDPVTKNERMKILIRSPLRPSESQTIGKLKPMVERIRNASPTKTAAFIKAKQQRRQQSREKKHGGEDVVELVSSSSEDNGDDESPTKSQKKPKKSSVTSKVKAPASTSKSKAKKRKVAPSENDAGESSDDDDVALSVVATSHSASKSSKKGGTVSPSKKLKQLSLFEKAKQAKNKALAAPKKPSAGFDSPAKRAHQQYLSIVTNLVKFHNKQLAEPQNKEYVRVYGNYAGLAVKQFTEKQVEGIPDEYVRRDIALRRERLDEKEKLNKMSVEERQAYLKEKQRKRAQLRKLKEKRERMRTEDKELDAKPLPEPELVDMHESFPNELFGSVAMITEFFHCYRGLLLPNRQNFVTSDALVKALVSGVDGSAYLGHVLVALLQTLLQDEIAEDYKDLTMKLSEVVVTEFNAGELARLCLLKKSNDPLGDMDLNDDESDSSDVSTNSAYVDQGVIDELERHDFYQLDARMKLSVLTALVQRILAGYSIVEYQEIKQQELTNAWKDKLTVQTRLNKEKQESKDKQKDGTSAKSDTLSTQPKEGESATDVVTLSGEEDSAAMESREDLATIVKRRRQLAAEEKLKREERAKVESERRAKELAEQQKVRERETVEKKYDIAAKASRQALRWEPLGRDRNHCRYWLFSKTIPGLFVEKGWMTLEELSYEPQKRRPSGDDALGGSEGQKQPPQAIAVPEEDEDEEKTIPVSSQNLWYQYTSYEDVCQLLDALHAQGVRESQLKTELQRRLGDVKDSFVWREKLKENPDASTRQKDLKMDNLNLSESFKAELNAMENHVRLGALGGVADFQEWLQMLVSAETVPALVECLLLCFRAIHPQFLGGMMASKASQRESGEQDKTESHQNSEQEEFELRRTRRIERWVSALQQCGTLSRLHFLFGVLHACVKWDRSVEYANCRICRRKGDEGAMLLCDTCNTPFHMFCLRPALTKIPKGNWYCNSCKPNTRREEARRRRYKEASTSESEQEEEGEEIEHETRCAICDGEAEETDELVPCSQCPFVYHKSCHNPPLRHAPRGAWVCNRCQTGGSVRKTRVKTKRRAAASRRRNERLQEDDDQSSADEIRVVAERPRRANKERQRRVATVKEMFTGSDYDNEVSDREAGSESRASEDNYESDDDATPARRSTRAAAAKAITRLREGTTDSYSDTASVGSSARTPISTRARDQDSNVYNAVTEQCDEFMKQILGSRLANSLMLLPAVSGRHGRGSGSNLDLATVKGNLKKYTSVEQFVRDIREVINNGKQAFKGNERKIQQLVELGSIVDTLVTELESTIGTQVQDE